MNYTGLKFGTSSVNKWERLSPLPSSSPGRGSSFFGGVSDRHGSGRNMGRSDWMALVQRYLDLVQMGS